MTEHYLDQDSHNIGHEESFNTIPVDDIIGAISLFGVGLGSVDHNGLGWPGLPLDITSAELYATRSIFKREDFEIQGTPTQDAHGNFSSVRIYGTLPSPLKRKIDSAFGRETEILASIIKYWKPNRA